MLHLFCVERLCEETFFKSKQAATFFSPLFINDGILLHLYTYFICINFISVCYTLLPHLKDCIFILFCILSFIYQFPLLCIGLHSKMYFLMKYFRVYF